MLSISYLSQVIKKHTNKRLFLSADREQLPNKTLKFN